MAQRRVFVPELGEVILAKRRGTRNLRLSITARGEIRVGMPLWAPYVAGIAFAKSRSDWIKSRMNKYDPIVLNEGMLIGKAHRLHFGHGSSSPSGRIKSATIEITGNLPFDDHSVQAKARATAERALRSEAALLLPQRLRTLATKHGFSYRSVRVRKLTSRWGSCSHDRSISLSYYLIQLPWRLIDYVLLHELVHTKHLNHGTDFWETFERVLPDARSLRRDIKMHNPRLEPS